MDIKLIDREKVKIKAASAKDLNCTINENQIILANNNEINTPITLKIELENDSFITNFELVSDRNEQVINKVKVFINSSHLDEWESVPILESYKKENKVFFQLPLIKNKNIQIILVPEYGIKKHDEFKVILSNNINTQLKATSTGDRLWVVENLIDQRQDYGWASKTYEVNTKESIEIDLNRSYYLSAIALKSINENKNCFPIKFTISTSDDQISWNTVANESDFYVACNTWYKWDYSIQKARFLKIDILEHYPVAKKLFCSKLLELEVYTIPENVYNSLRNRYLSQTVASELISGSVRLAENKSTRPGVVIQGNDSRLRHSTTEYSGIIQLAKHNESEQGKALQSDDPRLNEGSLQEKGRVQLAQDGEDSEWKVVQGSDKRLQPATINDFGIVRLANPGVKVKGAVVQSDDPRLFDSRKPLEHTHNYAEKKHSFDSHTGYLRIDRSEKTENIDPSFYSNTTRFPFSVKNDDGVAAGFSGGIFSYSDKNISIVAGASSKTAILAYSRNSAAGEFISENDYAINLPNKLGPIKGSRKSMRSEGLVSILGGIEIAGETAFVVKWGKFLSEAFSHGDLLTIDGSEQVQKIKSGKHNLIGVYVKDPKLVLQADNSDKPGIYIAVAGIVQIKIRGQVSAGESIGFINADPGVAQKTTKNHALGTSLETSNENGDKLVWCVLKN